MFEFVVLSCPRPRPPGEGKLALNSSLVLRLKLLANPMLERSSYESNGGLAQVRAQDGVSRTAHDRGVGLARRRPDLRGWEGTAD